MSKRKSLSKDERQAVYDRTGGHCAYCGAEIGFDDMVIAHVVYTNAERQDLNADVIDELLLACKECGRCKDDMTLEKIRAALERMPDDLMRNSAVYRAAVRFGLVRPTPHRVVFYFEKSEREKTLRNSGWVDF